jgi:hypothetical protein
MAFGFALSPSRALGRSRAGLVAAIVFVGLSLGGAGWAIAETFGATYARTVDRIGWRQESIGGVRLEIPRLWSVKDRTAVDPTTELRFTIVVGDAEDLVDGPLVAPPAIGAPDGWTEADAVTELKSEDSKMMVRVARFERDGAPVIWGIVPDARTAELAPIVRRVVRSAGE